MSDIQKYETHLTEELASITSALQTIGIHNPENPSDWIAVPKDLDAEEPDLNLAADNVEDWNERNALVATLEPRYNDIVRALGKISAGTFGTCEVCNVAIEEKRLEVDPSARTCMAHIEEPLD